MLPLRCFLGLLLTVSAMHPRTFLSPMSVARDHEVCNSKDQSHLGWHGVYPGTIYVYVDLEGVFRRRFTLC